MTKAKQKIDSQRLGMYRKIEIGRKQLPEMGDEDFFRDWLEDNFGKRSRKALSNAQLALVVDTLGRRGAVYTSGGSNKKLRPHVRPDWIEIPDSVKHAKEKREICAIWHKLGYSMTSLETRIKRQFKQPTIMWVHDINKLSVLLNDLQKREKAFDKKQAASEGNS